MNMQGRQRSPSCLVSVAIVVLGVQTLFSVHLARGDGFQAQTVQHNHEAHTAQDNHEAHTMKGVRVEIHMRDGRYYVESEEGTDQKELLLKAGGETTVILRNEDQVAHEFITPLFLRTKVQFSGTAVGLFGTNAVGFRLNPGKNLTLRFKAPFFSQPFHIMYDMAWCDLHRKGESQAKQRELLIVATHEVP